MFIAEGVRAVDELLRSSLTVRGALLTASNTDERAQTLASTIRDRGIPLQEVTEAEFQSAAETETPQGILAIGAVPSRDLSSLDVPKSFRLIVLDAVQDPGNVGTILRTAAALGATATIALPGTVDLWNAKVVRSSMGAHFHHPAFACTWETLTSFLTEHEVQLWGADAAGEPLDAALRSQGQAPDRIAIAVGNEGAGLSSQTRDRAERLVAIEIARDVESLNVAVATGIMLYQLRS
jgi:TrmH family RNA methyltransferase